jgi:hypothetical protein
MKMITEDLLVYTPQNYREKQITAIMPTGGAGERHQPALRSPVTTRMEKAQLFRARSTTR